MDSSSHLCLHYVPRFPLLDPVLWLAARQRQNGKAMSANTYSHDFVRGAALSCIGLHLYLSRTRGFGHEPHCCDMDPESVCLGHCMLLLTEVGREL